MSALQQQFLDAFFEWVELVSGRSMEAMIRHARDREISMTQLGALFHISRHTQEGVADVGKHMGISAPAASQMLDRLVDGGLLERSEDPEDRRVRRLRLTEKGRNELHAAFAARRRGFHALAEALSDEEVEETTGMFRMLNERMRKIELAANESSDQEQP